MTSEAKTAADVSDQASEAVNTIVPEGSVVEYRDPATLGNHAMNASIYGTEPNEFFVEDVRLHGVQNPIQITAADSELPNTIVSGHQRNQAAKIVGLATVPVIVRTDLRTRLDIEEALIVLNTQRVKTNEQIGREFAELTRIEGERRAAITAAGGTTAGMGRVEDAAAEKLGVNRETGRRSARAVTEIDKRAAEGDVAGAKELTAQLNTSATAADAEAKRSEQRRQTGGIVDPNGVKVPRNLHAIFDAVPVYTKLRREIRRAIGDVEELAKGKASGRLATASIKAELTNAANALDDATPYCVCPHCKGKGKSVQAEGAEATDCSLCDAEGWVTELTWRSLRDAEQRKADKAGKSKRGARAPQADAAPPAAVEPVATPDAPASGTASVKAAMDAVANGQAVPPEKPAGKGKGKGRKGKPADAAVV